MTVLSNDNGMGSERRHHKRVYFSRNTRITVGLSVPGISRRTIQARILNLSEGGIALSYRRDHGFTVVKGTFLSIYEINGVDGLKCIQGKSVEVRWVLDDETFETIGAGCKFYGFNEADRNVIRKFVDTLAVGKNAD